MENITAKEFLKKLADIETDFNIYVPSLGKSVETLPLTLKQQKDIISTATGGARGSLEFTRSINDAILKNVKEKKLYPYDRVPVIVQLRKHSLGDRALTDDYEFASLEDIIKNCKNEKASFVNTGEITVDSLKLKLRIPTLEEENEIISKCLIELDKIDPEDITETVGTVFVFELIKYIHTISIKNDIVAFSDLKIQDRVDIIERLPLSVYNELVSFLRQIGKYEADILAVGDSYVSIDAAFFEGNIFDPSADA
tara:strand:- start:232 stop:993 length:762 start_codon:yes stop_codon:yes gene_type:complete